MRHSLQAREVFRSVFPLVDISHYPTMRNRMLCVLGIHVRFTIETLDVVHAANQCHERDMRVMHPHVNICRGNTTEVSKCRNSTL